MSKYKIQNIVDGHYHVGFGHVIDEYMVENFLQQKNACVSDPLACIANIDGKHIEMYACLFHSTTWYFFDENEDFIGKKDICDFDWVYPPYIFFYCTKDDIYIETESIIRSKSSNSNIFILNKELIALIKYNKENDIATNDNIIEYLDDVDRFLERTIVNSIGEKIDIVRLG